MRKRRIFTTEFKREAVHQLEVGEKSPSDLARELGIPRNKLYRWKEEIDRLGGEAFLRSGSEKSIEMADENKRLKKELDEAREDIEILKKATVFFAERSK